MGLEPMTLRLKVWCSTDWANRALCTLFQSFVLLVALDLHSVKVLIKSDIASVVQRVIQITTLQETKQSGAVEACWAHNPEVRGSKPRSAITLFFFAKATDEMNGLESSTQNNVLFKNACTVTLAVVGGKYPYLLGKSPRTWKEKNKSSNVYIIFFLCNSSLSK